MHLLNICVFVEPDSVCERKKTTKWCRNAGQRERAAGLGDGTLVRMSGFVTKKEQLQVTSEKKRCTVGLFFLISVLVGTFRPRRRWITVSLVLYQTR